jgi:hypothetical protein
LANTIANTNDANLRGRLFQKYVTARIKKNAIATERRINWIIVLVFHLLHYLVEWK